MTVGEEELDTSGQHLESVVSNLGSKVLFGLPYNTLLHRKALLVVAASDANNLLSLHQPKLEPNVHQ